MEKNVLSDYFAALGKIGGKKLKAQKLAENPNYYKELGKKGAEKRAQNKKDKLGTTQE